MASRYACDAVAIVGGTNASLPKTDMASINPATLSLNDVYTTPHGAKVAQIRDGGGALVIQPNEFLRVPFEPSAFNESDAQRLNLFIEAPRPVLEMFAALDEWLIGYLAEHSSRLFKKPLTTDEIRAKYQSCVRHSDKGYMPAIKTKVDLSDGKHALHCWDGNGSEAVRPESWRNCYINPRLHVTHLWFMGSNFGPAVRLTDAQVLPPPDEDAADRKCPF